MLTPTAAPPRFRLVSGLLVGTCVLGLWAPSARAGEAEALAEPPAVRATPRPIPAGLLADQGPAPLQLGPAKSNVFFMNYAGVVIKYTGALDDSSKDITMFKDFARTYVPYGEGVKRAASFQAVKADWAAYNVTITDQRPAAGNYTMSVNSPTNPIGPGVLGVAPLDCNDQLPRNIVFAFHGANDQFSASTQATTMSQEIAHAYGLEHVKEPGDIMNPYNAGGDPSFLNKCLPLDAGGGQILCGQQHAEFCAGSAQNSHAELVALFGASAPDVTPPSVQIVSPGHGQMLPAGSDFDILIEASDAGGLEEVQLFNNGALLGSYNAEPFKASAVNTPPGSYCFTARAFDLAKNQADSNEVCVTVTENSAPEPEPEPVPEPVPDPTADPPTTSAGDTGGDSAGSAGSTGAAGEDSGAEQTGGSEQPSPDSAGPALPPGYGQDGEGACSVQSRPLPLAGLLLLLLGLVRRRRAA